MQVGEDSEHEVRANPPDRHPVADVQPADQSEDGEHPEAHRPDPSRTTSDLMPTDATNPRVGKRSVDRPHLPLTNGRGHRSRRPTTRRSPRCPSSVRRSSARCVSPFAEATVLFSDNEPTTSGSVTGPEPIGTVTPLTFSHAIDELPANDGTGPVGPATHDAVADDVIAPISTTSPIVLIRVVSSPRGAGRCRQRHRERAAGRVREEHDVRVRRDGRRRDGRAERRCRAGRQRQLDGARIDADDGRGQRRWHGDPDRGDRDRGGQHRRYAC